MSSIWYYEPFYDLDRFLDETFTGRLDSSNQRRRIESGETSGAVRATKPRYVIITYQCMILSTPMLTICFQDGPS